MIYCNDVDLLRWEPQLFRDAAMASQVLLSGSGDLNGTAFTIASGSFSDSAVRAGDVITLEAPIAASLAVVAVVSDTELTVSVLQGDLFPSDGSAVTPVGAGLATGVGFSVRTFMPQARIVSQMLRQAVGVELPGNFDPPPAILTPEAMTRPCVLGTLQMIYSAMAAVAGDSAMLAVHADLYRRLYGRALRTMAVDLDTNGDGVADLRRSPGVVCLIRA
jgi:hypothetical protein